MFKQCHHLLRQVDVFLSGREQFLSIGSQHAAREELNGLVAEVRVLIEPNGPDAVSHCEWELTGIERAAHTALALVDAMTQLSHAALTRCRHEFEASVQECERWVMRTQAEASTVAGPTLLPLVNLACRGREVHDEISVRCHLYSVLDQCEATLEGPFHSAAERAAWESLTAVVRDNLSKEKPTPLAPVLVACRAIELAQAETAQWTSWASLNRLISVAAKTVFGLEEPTLYASESQMLHAEMEANELITVAEARRLAGTSHRALLTRLQSCFAVVRGLISDLDTAVAKRSDVAVPACVRRLRWTLTDLAVCRAEMEALPAECAYVSCFQCQEHNALTRSICQRCSAVLPRSANFSRDTSVSLIETDGHAATPTGPVLTTRTEPIVRAVESYRRGQITAEALQRTLLALQSRLDKTSELLPDNCQDVDVERFEHGVDNLYMALGQWGEMLELGTQGTAEAGLEHFHRGVELLVQSQLPSSRSLAVAVGDFGLVA